MILDTGSADLWLDPLSLSVNQDYNNVTDTGVVANLGYVYVQTVYVLLLRS